MEKSNELVVINSLVEFLEQYRPSIPVYTTKPSILLDKAKLFLEYFPGKVLYSVKSNPNPETLKHLYNAGIKTFDVASLKEVQLIHHLFPDAELFFMHPIKSRDAIRKAYFDYNVKTFSLDSLDELNKILEETGYAKDLSLHVRISTTDASSVFNLSSKFGINVERAGELVKRTRQVANTFGICFHVGSQCMDPHAYTKALKTVSHFILGLGVHLDVIDVGGGFPVRYPTMTPLAQEDYLKEVNAALIAFKDTLGVKCEAWCEPGRALVAESGSLVVRVEARKQNMLYLNDGTYGGLFDAGVPNFIYPTAVYRTKTQTLSKGALNASTEGFGFYGPTCDSMDVMNGPFFLPSNVAEGDYIEIKHLGAYSKSIRTNFNGFEDCLDVEITA